MSDLATWLRAQLDEDERIAKECDYWAPPPWVGAFKQVTSEPGGLALVRTVASTNSAQVSHHIEHWEPARVLTEVEAKRRILEEHTADSKPEWETIGGPVPVVTRSGHVTMTTYKPGPERVTRPTGRNLYCCRICDVYWEDYYHPEPGCPTVRLLALPYATRDGYRDEWRPA